MAAVAKRDGEKQRDAEFIARANRVKEFIQRVATFALSVSAAVVAAVLNMAGLVAILAVLSPVFGVPSFLWLIECRNWYADPARISGVLRGYFFAGPALLLALAMAVSSSLILGARVGMMSHLLVYGAEFAIAIVVRSRRLLKSAP